MKMINKFLKISLSLSRFAKGWIRKLFGSFADAARSISYVETVNSTQSDTLHREIKRSSERLFKRGFEQCVRFVLRSLPFNQAKVAIDITEDAYWGTSSLHTLASVHKRGEEIWQWVTLSIVEPYFVPLMSLPYKQTDNLDELVIELLDYLHSLPLQVGLILFDRGFYHWKLIDYLNGKKRGWSWPYLILVPKNKAMKKFIEQTQGDIDSFDHCTKYKRDQTTWRTATKIAILKGATKNKKGEAIDWCFATNKPVHHGLVTTYKKRWNIETGFRIHDEARIKTKSKHPLIRYFFHLLSMLFILMWRVHNSTVQYTVFKTFLKRIEEFFKPKICLKCKSTLI